EHFACDSLLVARADIGGGRSLGEFLSDVDGEALGGIPLEVTLVREALVVRVPAPGMESTR
ncbi:MAG: hypothetical protein ACREJ3_01875, partial [Polyangiaceae bacterium]